MFLNDLISGEMQAGREINPRIVQTFTQDATGSLVILEFNAMKVPRV